MVFNLANALTCRRPSAQSIPLHRLDGRHIDGCNMPSSVCQERAAILPRHRGVCLLFAAMLMVTVADAASAQSVSALIEPQVQIHTSAKPMTPERVVWLKGRCAQLVAFFDRYGVSRGENSDGPRNHTRIGAVIECERARYRNGIDTMAALLVRKTFTVPKPGTPVVEPEDIEAPGITNPTRPWYWF